MAKKAARKETKWRTVRDLALGFWQADPLTLAASIAFYTALSFAPVVILGMIGLSELSPGEELRFVDEVRRLFGAEVGRAAMLVIENADTERLDFSGEGLVAVGALLVSATTAFGQLQAALNRVWGVPAPARGAVLAWLRQRFFSLGILAVLAFLLTTALVVSTVLAALLTREGAWWLVLNEGVTLAALAIAFAMLFRFVPDAVPPWRGALLGGAITAALFEAGKWGLGAYLAATTSDDAYGAASSLILLLLWVYYSSLIVLVGAALTRALGHWQRWETAPRRAATA